jgi:ureidoacrylate peracid hydrolase
MHSVTVRQEIVDRVLQRRGRYHLFDRLDPKRTALIVIDMQTVFCAPGSPAEVPASRGIVEPINGLAAELRELGVPVIWVLHANSRIGDKSDWELFFNTIVADEVRERTLESLTAGKQTVWSGLVTAPADHTVLKNRYSALIPGSSALERVLRGMGIDTLLVAGTKTNICCESTARDAMMLDYRVVMLSDATAASTLEEHVAALNALALFFADVMTVDEALGLLHPEVAVPEAAVRV